jgi:hypothetical protein
MSWRTLILFILVCFCAGCFQSTDSDSDTYQVVVTEVRIVEVTPTPQRVEEFEGASTFFGTAGTYNIECTSCSATVVNTVQCLAIAPKGYGLFLEEIVEPSIRVVHGAESYEGTSYGSEDASGLWVIQNLLFTGHTITAGDIEPSIEWFMIDGQQFESCLAEATLTVFFTEGGGVRRIS